ncbi:MAG: glycosyl hydrolase [Bacteroidales bacterium]|nr:glycosyl hydrolase [Bacteroidales bacterium]
MKKILFSMIVSIVANIFLNAQQPWQQFSDISTKEIAGNFKSPPSEYGMILWWGWDGPMTDTVIKRDLDRIKAMGFRGVMVEAGYGMTAKYLSPEWFALVKIAVGEAKTRGMRVWIEDEGKYPSGFAGGKFSNERPDLKMQGLIVTERIDATGGESISKKLPYYTLSAVAFNNDDKSSKIIDVNSGELNWQVPDGSWRIFLAENRFRSSVTRSVNNPARGKDTTASLFDYLNPLATRQFLDWTHEQYKKYIGNEFGKTFMGFMGDEPDFAYTPWTPKILEEFKARKGYDVKPYLASFFVPQLNEEAKRIKADYWDVWSDLFRDNFFKVQADWCRENNIEYIVHLNHEDQVPGLVKSSGDFFKNMRYVGVPGVDVIWAQIWMDHVADYPKMASSASHLYGRPRSFTESFAAFTHRPSVPQAKWVLDYQLVRGINSVQIMFMSASTARISPVAAPVNTSAGTPALAVRRTSFFMSDTFPPIAGYINRATYLLSQGRPASRIGVYFPTSSMMYGDNESNTSTLEISRQLMEQQQDFDFIDEQSLTSILNIGKGSMTNLSGQLYEAIIVPSVSVISKASLLKLQQFASSGGKVIFVGNLPALATDINFLKAVKPDDPGWAKQEPSGKITQGILNFLPAPDVKIDKSCPDIKYLHRKLKDAELYFLFNEGKEKQSLQVTLSGKGKPQVWDAMTGQVNKLHTVVYEKDAISVPLAFEPYETKFIIISK